MSSRVLAYSSSKPHHTSPSRGSVPGRLKQSMVNKSSRGLMFKRMKGDSNSSFSSYGKPMTSFQRSSTNYPSFTMSPQRKGEVSRSHHQSPLQFSFTSDRFYPSKPTDSQRSYFKDASIKSTSPHSLTFYAQKQPHIFAEGSQKQSTLFNTDQTIKAINMAKRMTSQENTIYSTFRPSSRVEEQHSYEQSMRQIRKPSAISVPSSDKQSQYSGAQSSYRRSKFARIDRNAIDLVINTPKQKRKSASRVGKDSEKNDVQWSQIMNELSQNPGLLLRILPEKHDNSKVKNRLHKKILENRKKEIDAMLRRSEEPFRRNEASRGQYSHISFEQRGGKNKLMISPREKKEHLGRLSKFMNHIKQKKQQPLSLRSMKKSLSKLKQRPRTSGTVLSVLPKVRSIDFPKPPDSVRLKQKDGINSDGSNGPPTFRPSTASTSHPFASKKVDPEEPTRLISKPQRNELISSHDGPGLAYFPENEESQHFPAPDQNSEVSRKMHAEIQAQALKCLQICGSNYSSSGSSIQTLQDDQDLEDLDESNINLPKKNSRPRSVATSSQQRYLTSQPASRAYESSKQLAKRPIDWDARKQSNHNPQQYEQDVDLMIQNVNQSSLSSLMRASSASMHQFEVMRNSKSSSGRQTIVQKAKDWAFSALCIQVKENRIQFGRKLDEQVYRQEEIDYTATMLRHRHVELTRSELLLPIFERARNTLFELMNELLLSAKVQKIRLKYQIPSLENTFRFLFKSKKLFTARSRVIEILKLLIRRREISQELNSRLKQADTILQDDSKVDELFELTKFHKNQLHILTRLILNLQKDFKFLKQRFLYYGEDVLTSMKQELQSIQMRMRQAILFTHD